MPRVSQLPLTTGVGTVYVIEGGVSKRVVLGSMALQSASAVAIIGGTASLSAISSSGVVVSNYGGSGGSDSAFVATHSAGPKVGWNVTGQPANGRLWDIAAIGNQWSIRAVNDALSAASPAVRVTRSAANIASIEHLVAGTVVHLINSAGQSVTGSSRVTSQFEIGDGGGSSAHFLNVSNSSRSARISIDPGNVGASSQFDLYVDGSEVVRWTAGQSMFTGIIGVAGQQVLGARKTGWSAASGTATRTSFATGSVTLPQLAERVKALLDDLISHGLIGA